MSAAKMGPKLPYYDSFHSITGQLYFCAMPMRIDPYNRCQFGCIYCFSRKRSQNTSLSGLKVGRPGALLDRLNRVARGRLSSALDEFLERRITVQLGGMHDPFSPIEKTHKVTLGVLKALAEHRYPTAISTKGSLCIEDTYIEEIKAGNFYVRLSAAGVLEKFRNVVDYRCDSFQQTLAKLSVLSTEGVPASLRIQPIIPGHEDSAIDMAEAAIDHGAVHISFEYLKIPSESRSEIIQSLEGIAQPSIYSLFESGAFERVGYDYALRSDYKKEFLARASALCRDMGVSFGAGDTEFIHLSDGGGCCGAASTFLCGANEFTANFTGAIKGRACEGELRFSDFLSQWQPKLPVSPYLSSRSRAKSTGSGLPDWAALVAYRWNGKRSIYSPDFFRGVSWGGRKDSDGYRIYEVDSSTLPLRWAPSKKPP